MERELIPDTFVGRKVAGSMRFCQSMIKMGSVKTRRWREMGNIILFSDSKVQKVPPPKKKKKEKKKKRKSRN